MKVLAEVRYEKLAQIGVGLGANSKVYRARDPQLEGVIAVKEIEKARFPSVSEYFEEAKAMYKSKHDNIVPVHYACETSSHVCIAMPLFKRGSFSKLIENGPAPLSIVLRVGRAVLSALSQIHLSNLLHLDVKPSNVLLSDSGVPMLSDFGQSRRMSSTGVATAPPLYAWSIPPEAFGGLVVAASDIYQTGLLLYRAMNGDPHFNGQHPSDLQTAITSGRFPRRDKAEDFLPHVPRRLRTVIRKALRVDPAGRYQTAIEFADELGKVDFQLDWATSVQPTGGFKWQAARHGQPSFLVTAEPTATTWKTCVYTVPRDGKPRAKGKSVFWRDGMSWPVASKHLTEVFASLL